MLIPVIDLGQNDPDEQDHIGKISQSRLLLQLEQKQDKAENNQRQGQDHPVAKADNKCGRFLFHNIRFWFMQTYEK